MRRGFTVVELTIGMAITAVLLTGLFAALQSSVDAYAKSSADGVNSALHCLFERVQTLGRYLLAHLTTKCSATCSN